MPNSSAVNGALYVTGNRIIVQYERKLEMRLLPIATDPLHPSRLSMLAAVVAACALVIVNAGIIRASHGPSDATFCEYEDTVYLCGEIWVELNADADSSIEEAVVRQGGDPDDVINEVQSQGARSTGTFYVVAVGVGHEPEEVDNYTVDLDVAQAIFSTEGVAAGAEADYVVENKPLAPDTALAAPAGLSLMTFLGLVMLLALSGLIRRRARR